MRVLNHHIRYPPGGANGTWTNISPLHTDRIECDGAAYPDNCLAMGDIRKVVFAWLQLTPTPFSTSINQRFDLR